MGSVQNTIVGNFDRNSLTLSIVLNILTVVLKKLIIIIFFLNIRCNSIIQPCGTIKI